MRHGIRSWGWRWLLAGALLFPVMGQDCDSDDGFDDLGDWFSSVWGDVEDWF